MSRSNDGLPMLPPWLADTEVTGVGQGNFRTYEPPPVENLPQDQVIPETPEPPGGFFNRRGRGEDRGESSGEKKKGKGWFRNRNRDEAPLADRVGELLPDNNGPRPSQRNNWAESTAQHQWVVPPEAAGPEASAPAGSATPPRQPGQQSPQQPGRRWNGTPSPQQSGPGMPPDQFPPAPADQFPPGGAEPADRSQAPDGRPQWGPGPGAPASADRLAPPPAPPGPQQFAEPPPAQPAYPAPGQYPVPPASGTGTTAGPAAAAPPDRPDLPVRTPHEPAPEFDRLRPQHPIQEPSGLEAEPVKREPADAAAADPSARGGVTSSPPSPDSPSAGSEPHSDPVTQQQPRSRPDLPPPPGPPAGADPEATSVAPPTAPAEAGTQVGVTPPLPDPPATGSGTDSTPPAQQPARRLPDPPPPPGPSDAPSDANPASTSAASTAVPAPPADPRARQEQPGGTPAGHNSGSFTRPAPQEQSAAEGPARPGPPGVGEPHVPASEPVPEHRADPWPTEPPSLSGGSSDPVAYRASASDAVQQQRAPEAPVGPDHRAPESVPAGPAQGAPGPQWPAPEQPARPQPGPQHPSPQSPGPVQQGGPLPPGGPGQPDPRTAPGQQGGPAPQGAPMSQGVPPAGYTGAPPQQPNRPPGQWQNPPAPPADPSAPHGGPAQWQQQSDPRAGQWQNPVPGGVPGGGPSLANVPVRRAKKPAGTGWRKVVHHASGGKINPGMSAEERRLQELVARIRQPVRGDYRIAVLSLKGGVGKTTTTIGLGSTFSSVRGDRVIAVDANPDFGTLSQRVPLQTRSTVRDLLLDPAIQRYSDVRRHTSQATSRLEVLASERDPAASEAFNEDEYRAVARILQRFYNIILTDCGTGLMHSAMAGVLQLAHSLVLISPTAIDGAQSASATLDWLSLHGYHHLVQNAVVVINSPREGTPNIDVQQLRQYFLSRCRAVHMIPFDPHMSEGAEIDLTRLEKKTKRAYVELAATVADDFGRSYQMPQG